MKKAAIMTVAALFGYIIGLLVALPLAAINAAFIATIWGWLVVPIFALKPITFWQAYACTIMLSAVRGYNRAEIDRTKETVERVGLTRTYAELAGWYALTLGVAWIAKHFV
jgi:uncharacterized membrane protein